MHLNRIHLMATVSMFLSPISVSPVAGQTTEPSGQAEAGGSSVENEGEIVVTALRRETSLQQTPLAITATTGDRLAAMGIGDTTALGRISPGLVLRESGLSGTRITIRNIRAAGEPTVGLYYDDVPIMGSAGVNADAGGTLPAIRLFDVERVEVLRGPQGTLYGSSSMAGAVRLIFAKPDLDAVAGSFAGQVSHVANGGPGFETQAMINLPVLRDLAAVRFVGFVRDQPGFVDNIRLGRNDVNKQQSWGGRAMLRIVPTADVTIDLMASKQSLNGSLNDYFLAAGSYNATYEALQPLRDDNELYSATVDWRGERVGFTVVGSHGYRDFNYSYDFSAFFRATAGLFPAGSANFALFNDQAPSVANSSQITKTDTLEARLHSVGEGALDWTLGAFYADRRGDIQSNIIRASPASGEVLPVTASSLLGQRLLTDRLKQTAAFGEVTWRPVAALSLTGGLRYFDYSRAVTGVVSVVNRPVGFTPAPQTRFRASEDGLLYKANASYELTPRMMVYATVSSGQRPGGVNQLVNLAADLVSYRADKLWNYEVGAKTQWFDRRLTLNGALFQMNWDDMQTAGALPATNFAFIANAGAARVRGVELEATMLPLDGLELQASGSYIDAKLTENQSNQTLIAPGLKGDPIPFVPKVTAQGGAQYAWDAGGGLRATLRSDVSYGGPSWTEFRHTSAFQRRLPAFTTVGARLSLEGREDGWTIAMFVNNLFDADTVVTKLSANVYGGLNNVRAISLMPRTIGLDFSKRF